jgi:orotate phosphoribosyltransferase
MKATERSVSLAGTQEMRKALMRLIDELGYERREQPFQLSSGEWSRDYFDGKRALSSGESLRLAAECVVALAKDEGVGFDAAGGLTMGADPIAHAVAVVSGAAWFSVRKEAKQHGKQQLIEGAHLEAGTRVLLVDDVVTTGSSILKALDAVEEAGATVTLAVSLVDRGDQSRRRLRERGVRYEPITTYEDFGIEPVGA